MGQMVFFNVAWMNYYKGVTPNDRPTHGGAFIPKYGYGFEVYNFLPHEGKMYGFVEAGCKPKLCRINITKLNASKKDSSVSDILVIWVARHPKEPSTLVVGWYKNATVYTDRQKSPANSTRRLPNGGNAPYFAIADKENCCLVPTDKRQCVIPRGEGGLGQKNIWYATGSLGQKTKAKVLDYINNHKCNTAPR